MGEYINLDQTIHILPNFSIVFSFYDHNTLGENMMHIYLEEDSTKEIITLRLDTPYDNIMHNKSMEQINSNVLVAPLVSSFLHEEVDKILEKALKNPLNNQLYHMNSRNAICCCLNMIYPITKNLLKSHNVQLHNINWMYSNLNVHFPNFVPTNQQLEYKNIKMDDKFGYKVIMDDLLIEQESNRSNNSKWNDKKKLLFGKFIKALYENDTNDTNNASVTNNAFNPA